MEVNDSYRMSSYGHFLKNSGPTGLPLLMTHLDFPISPQVPYPWIKAWQLSSIFEINWKKYYVKRARVGGSISPTATKFSP